MIDEEDTWAACIKAVEKGDTYLKALRQLLEVEEENPHGEWIGDVSPTGVAWEVVQTKVSQQVITYFSRIGLVSKFYNTRSTKAYHMVNTSTVAEFIEAEDRGRREVELVQEHKKALEPEELFEWISGYEDEKRWLRKWAAKRIDRGDWTPEQGEPTVSTGIALVGPGGTAKSDFLMDCANLPKAYFTTGTYLSSAGLWDILYDGDYWFLIIDECEKMSGEDWNLLYTLLGNMFIKRDQRNRHAMKMMDVNVLVASNNWTKVAEAMQQRYRDWHFTEYTLEEYLHNAKYCLIHRYDVDPALAEHIAETTSQFTRHVRTAIFYGLMCDDGADVDDLFNLEKKRGVKK
jgi:hypothetical protein